jgi:hypothetical protein
MIQWINPFPARFPMDITDNDDTFFNWQRQ